MLLDVVVEVLLDPIPGVVLGKLTDGRLRDLGQVPRRGVLIRVRQAGSIGEVAVGHAQSPGVLVHELGEGLLIAGNVLRQGDAGIVAGLDHHALDQFLQGDLLADLGEHARPTGAPGMLADQDLIVQRDMPRGQLVEDHIGSQNLGEAGGVQAVVGMELHQGLAPGVRHQQIALGRDLRRGQGRARGRPGHCGGGLRLGLDLGLGGLGLGARLSRHQGRQQPQQEQRQRDGLHRRGSVRQRQEGGDQAEGTARGGHFIPFRPGFSPFTEL